MRGRAEQQQLRAYRFIRLQPFECVEAGTEPDLAIPDVVLTPQSLYYAASGDSELISGLQKLVHPVENEPILLVRRFSACRSARPIVFYRAAKLGYELLERLSRTPAALDAPGCRPREYEVKWQRPIQVEMQFRLW